MGNKPSYEELEQRVKVLEQEAAKRQKYAEEALRESVARYRQIASSSPGVVYQFLLKKDGSYSSPYISENASNVLDISAEEVMADANSLFNMIVEEDLHSVNQSIAESAQTMKRWLQEFRIRDKAGKLRRIRATSIPRLLPNGEILWDGVLLDISDHIRAEKALQRIQNDLEELIEKRTAKLKKTNKRLKQEIKERKQAENALIQAKDEWEKTFESVPDAIMLLDKPFKITRVNKSMADLLGLSPDECAGQTCYRVLHGTEEPPSFCPHTKLLEDGQEHSEEFWEENLGGHFIVSTSPIYDTKGELTGSVHVARNITERKQADEELQKTLKELRDLESIVNRSPVMVFLWPVQEGWPVEFVTENVNRVIGYTADDFMSGKVSWPGITHPEDVPRLEAEVAEYFKEGITEFNQEYRLITKFGDIRWMRDRSKVLFDSNGTGTHIQSIVLDVTERKQAEEQWRFQSEIAINVSEGISLIRTCDYTIVYANPKFEEMFGYDPNEMVGKHISIVNAPTDKSPEEKAEEIVNILKKNGYWKGEVRNIKKDGTSFWCNASVSVFNHYKYGEVFVSVHQDITERKKVEEELVKHRQHLEELVGEQTVELSETNKDLRKKINENKLAMEELEKSEAELRVKTKNLEEVNTALKIMLKKKDEVKIEIEEDVLCNVKELVVPYLEKLKKARLNEEQYSYLNVLELNLNTITSSFSHKLSSKYIKLTPTEIRIANLIKHGNNTKEIAELLSLSRTTIDFHRQNIRKKLGIRNKKTNLRTYLLTFQQ
jgi:PAS domain S-box-containing protein